MYACQYGLFIILPNLFYFDHQDFLFLNNYSESPQIIALSGKQFAGKDMVTAWLLSKLPQYKQVPIALAIKQAYAKQHHLTLQHIETNKATYRPDLIALGNWGRQQDPDYWLKAVIQQSLQQPIIISDVRLQREYDLLRQQQAFLIRVDADRSVRQQRGALVSEDDPTECELDAVEHWDLVVDNNGSAEALYIQLTQAIPFI